MLQSLLGYFAWGLLLALVIASIAIVHREMRSLTGGPPPDEAGKRRGQAR